ncbi:sodium:proton antiporter, partial [Salmonella enterica subsp. enterica serovar Oranienburg]|nr:sodium:proton antiporter [Salmonella enterica subsp. enterica serovar Oranienburg]
MKLLSHWLLPDVVWAIPAGVLIGYGLGRLLGSMAVRLRAMSQDTAPSDLLALSLLVLTYAIAQYLHASAFLAAFAAGLG